MRLKTVLLVLLGLLIGATGAVLLRDHLSGAFAQQAELLAETEPSLPEADRRLVPGSREGVLLSYAPLVQEVSPAVVNVYSARRGQRRVAQSFFDQFFGRMQRPERTEQSLGSGVIVGGDGLIVTNNHVVENAEQILVALSDRREFSAELVFSDPQLDLALLKVDTRGTPLPTVPLGDSDQVEVGDIVVAIGNPFGVGQTVTSGIISAVARTGVGISDYQFFLQTDAAINPGNSGGALIGLDGQLVGVNTAIYSRSGGSNGIGFAIPVNMVRQFLSSAAAGRVIRPWLGADTQAVTRDIARSIGLDRPAGVIVRQVTPGSPADNAGLGQGDVVIAVNEEPVLDPNSLRYLTGSRGIDTPVEMTVLRDGERRSLTARLIEPPETPPRNETIISGRTILTGVRVANLSPRLASELGGGTPERGVIVTGIARGAPASRVNFVRTGDVIERVNGQDVTSVRQLTELAADTEQEAEVTFSRRGQVATCYFQAPSFFRCQS
ncbi:serine protease [Pacificimonas flava]|uniref:Serine protease n=2 Tax=Pacificimonas TaxID=1960290 RepID=A0A219B4D8_9SPHN|nr:MULTISPECIES: Do family serine endopeptidase [Pacificimonas]MBZ6377286.1 Do family serine endopeptidase [Pacificimonas aurantium]OWV33003.1 serine protease [Pacificimonas flava]